MVATAHVRHSRTSKKKAPWFSKSALKLSSVREAIRVAWTQVPDMPTSWSVDKQQKMFSKLSRLIFAQECTPERPAPKHDLGV